MVGAGMQTRVLGRTKREVGVVGLGCWQLGGDWGDVGDDDAVATLHAALDTGVTFLDTADGYGDGRSEKVIGRVLAELRADGRPVPFVATKMGSRADPRVPEAFTAEAFSAWVDRSMANLGVDTLDLEQLHCPPTPVIDRDDVYDALDALVEQGRIAAYGVSVETCAEALTAIARPGVASVQIILNCLRLKPLDEVLPAAREAGVGVIARVPLASGLLSGKYDENTTFAANDHRTYNRSGQAFDVGETFAGVPFETGVQAARELARVAGPDVPLARFALRWILDQPGVSVVIPGARNAAQARANAAAAQADPLTPAQHDAVRDVYDRLVREHVHGRW